VKKFKSSFLKKYFCPDQFVHSVIDVDYQKLYKLNIKGLIFDIDNTIVEYNAFEIPDLIFDLFKELTSRGFEICFLSNNKKKRVSYFGELFNIKAFHTALKPTPFGLNHAIKSLDLSKDKLAIIGDQVFTDILCGKMQKIYTILVEPILERKDIFNKLKRKLELSIIKSFDINK
jgi:HAD superfamily phosphatase (TIGR01668 family)